MFPRSLVLGHPKFDRYISCDETSMKYSAVPDNRLKYKFEHEADNKIQQMSH